MDIQGMHSSSVSVSRFSLLIRSNSFSISAVYSGHRVRFDSLATRLSLAPPIPVQQSDTQRTRAAQRKSIRVHYRRYVHPSPDRARSSVHAGQRARHGAPSSASTASFPVLPSPLLSHCVQNVAVQGTDRLLYARRHSTLLTPSFGRSTSLTVYGPMSTYTCERLYEGTYPWTPACSNRLLIARPLRLASATRLWSSGKQPIALSTVPLLSLR